MIHKIIVNDTKHNDLNPVQFGYENCESGHFFGPAVRTFYLIHYVVSGCGIFKINNKTYTVNAGEMFVIPPYVETYYEADVNNPWNYIWIGFTSNSSVIEHLSDVIVCPEAEKIFHHMKSCEGYTSGRSTFLCARLWDLFVLILEKEKEKGSDYIKTALDCIHSEYMHNITITELSQRLNLDRTYFSYIFKDKMGISPKEYLLNHRMNTAAALIKNKDLSISSVARSVGYSDLYTFSKMFKRHFGVSPVKYRSHKKQSATD